MSDQERDGVWLSLQFIWGIWDRDAVDTTGIIEEAGGYGLGTYKVLISSAGFCWLLSAGSLGVMHCRPKAR